ncbi:MAG: phosphopentomutase [Atopobiaceae bacterium]|nr:phosphopentomutase [Atopobiaceae bacterium]
MAKRVFLIVLDSFGIGEAPDASEWGDEGSNTLCACGTSSKFHIPNMTRLGLLNIEGALNSPYETSLAPVADPQGAFARLTEASKGKDTTAGHWEMAGVISPSRFPTYPDGFPPEIIQAFEEKTGRGVLCNKPYSGTDVIRDFGREHLETGKLIVYTSADSVFQIAAHESLIDPEQLYEYCRIARAILTGPHGVGRVIARPFEGEWPNYERTSRRHDFSLEPTGTTMLDVLKEQGKDVLAVGKIWDIFAHRGMTDHVFTVDNPDGIEKTIAWMDRDFEGLCFTNLVDTDSIYGHRNDVDGYANAISYFDEKLNEILPKLRDDDLLMLCADHGCDPVTPSTDHSREYVPWVIAGPRVRAGVDLGTLPDFTDVAQTILDYLDAPLLEHGTSHLSKIVEA